MNSTISTALNSILRNKKSYWLLLIAISIISFSVRYDKLDSPEYVDEQTYVRLAQFLSTGRLASQTSLWTVYDNQGALVSWDNGVPIVEPWFDHPPFFSILSIPFLSFGSPRLLPIILGAVSTFLIMYLLRDKTIESILAGLIFTFFPFAIQLNAMMFIDNGSSFLFLLTIALTSKHAEDNRLRSLILAGISAGLSFLCKEIGICSIVYLLFYLLFTGGLRKHFKVLIMAIGIAFTWFGVGLILNKDLFIDVITAHIGRTGAIEYNYQNLLSTAVVSFSYDFNQFKHVTVSLILFLSWISVGSFVFSNGYKLIKLGISSFILTLLAIKYTWFFTWITMYPFFSIVLAYTISKISYVLILAGKRCLQTLRYRYFKQRKHEQKSANFWI